MSSREMALPKISEYGVWKKLIAKRCIAYAANAPCYAMMSAGCMRCLIEEEQEDNVGVADTIEECCHAHTNDCCPPA